MNLSDYSSCHLCPRSCGIDRRVSSGFCGCGDTIKAARAALHYWEEPCISGTRGSGTIFFSGCTLKCCFCQNYPISQQGLGKELTIPQLGDVFLSLQDQGAHNINLVTATQYLPSVITALDLVKHKLAIPIVYNCGGYERVEIVRELADYVDIWLPDLKYYDTALSSRYSQAKNYFDHASEAISQMVRQTGAPVLDSDGIMQSGVIIRHMVLPGAREDSIRLLHWIHDNLPKGQYYISLLSQYTPFFRAAKANPGGSEFPEICRRITTFEYEKVLNEAIALGLEQGFMQEKSSAKEEYTPPFDLEGLD